MVFKQTLFHNFENTYLDFFR